MRVACFGTLLAIVLIALPLSAAPPLPPGLEPEVMALAKPVPEAPLPSGWTLERMSIGERAVEFVLVAEGRRVPVVLRAKDDTGHGQRLGETASFVAWGPGALDAESRAAAEALVARVQANDRGTFWARAEALRTERRSERRGTRPVDGGVKENRPRTERHDEVQSARPIGALDDVRRGLTWALMLVAIAYVLVRRRPSVRTMGLLVVLVGVAFAIRWTLPPHAPIHTNDHGTAELRGLVSSLASPVAPVETDRYGVAYGQLLRPLVRIFGGGPEAVFGVNAAFGALSVGALFAAATLVFGTPLAGVVAGIALTVHPAHVVLSPTESPMVLALLLLLVGAALAVLASREGEPPTSADGASGIRSDERVRVLAALGAGAALANAAELGVTTIPLAAALWLLTFRRPRTALVAGLVLLPGLAMHLWSLRDVLAHAFATRVGGSVLERLLTTNNLLRDGQLVPTTLLLLGPVGFVLAGRGRWSRGVVLFGLFVLAFATGLIVLGARSDAIRYQVPAQVVLALAAGAFARLPFPRVSTVFVSLLLVAGAVPGLAMTRLPSLDAAAYEATRDAVRELGPEAVVVVPPRRMGEMHADFPEFVAPARNAPQETTRRPPSDPARCHVWVGAGCYRFTPEEARSGLLDRAPRLGTCPIRPECGDVARLVPPDAPTLEVRWIAREFGEVSCARPIAGVFPCRGR